MLAAKPEQPSVTDADYVSSSSRFPSVADYAKQETVVTTDYAKQDVKPKYLPSYDSPISRLVIKFYTETSRGMMRVDSKCKDGDTCISRSYVLYTVSHHMLTITYNIFFH